MKIISQTISVLGLCIILSNSIKAQCSDTQMSDIYTPNGSPVTTWLMCEASLTTREAFDNTYSSNYPLAEKIVTYNSLSSTRKFNCHGYAWLRVETGIDRWIGYSVTTEEDIYMTDGSYTQVSQETYPGKVSWGSGDHSAVTTNQQGWVISKWNQWPLFKHQKNYSPFGSSNLKYYVRSCTSTPAIASFTITNYMSGTGLSTCPSEQVTLSPIVPVGGLQILEGQWQASGCTVNSSSNSYITITAPSTIYASFTLQYRYRNACGWSAWTPIYGSTRNCAAGEDPYRVIGFSSIYPNPVSNVLNISINTGALSQSTPILRNASIPAYSIRLYNLQSILVRQTNIQGDNIELNVSDLPNGIYVIHVIDSKGVKIGEHKVVIKH